MIFVNCIASEAGLKRPPQVFRVPFLNGSRYRAHTWWLFLQKFRSPEQVCWPYLRKACNYARGRVFHGAISSLRVFIRVPVCAISISQSFYFCYLRSVQLRDLYITSLWENMEMRPASSKGSKPLNSFRIMTDYSVGNDIGAIYWNEHR